MKVEAGTITVRNRRRFWFLKWGQRDADIALNTSIPWQIEIRGGAAEVAADLRGIDLIELNVSYGMSSVDLKLPIPSGTVPFRVSGGVSSVDIHYPAGVPVRVRFTGWASAIQFDDELLTGIQNDLQFQSPGYEAAAGRYDIEISGNANMVNISAL